MRIVDGLGLNRVLLVFESAGRGCVAFALVE